MKPKRFLKSYCCLEEEIVLIPRNKRRATREARVLIVNNLHLLCDFSVLNTSKSTTLGARLYLYSRWYKLYYDKGVLNIQGNIHFVLTLYSFWKLIRGQGRIFKNLLNTKKVHSYGVIHESFTVLTFNICVFVLSFLILH